MPSVTELAKASLMSRQLLLLALLAAPGARAKPVTIQTDAARVDVAGDYIDAHDGCIVAHKGTFFLYGEAYGNQTLATPYPWKQWPRLKVYTSPDLVHWTLRGDPLPMVPNTLWIPNVQYVEKTQVNHHPAPQHGPPVLGRAVAAAFTAFTGQLSHP